MSDKQYTIHDDTVYEVSSNALYTTYTKCKVPVAKSVTPEWKGQAIPYKMWQDITDWCVLSYEKFKSETLVFLYYGLNKKDDENRWSFWIPPQITNGRWLSGVVSRTTNGSRRLSCLNRNIETRVFLI